MVETGKKSDVTLSALNGLSDEPRRHPTEYTTFEGVVLKLRPVSYSLIQAALKRHPRPEVPTWFNDEKNREEKNPMHPDYLAALQDWQIEQGVITLHATMAMGSQLISKPEWMDGPDDEGWAKEREEQLGVEIPTKENKAGRYVAWLKFYALGNDDTIRLQQAINDAGALIKEAEVDAQADGFRDN